MDFDSTRRKGAHGDIYRRMLRGEIDVLLGTQMVAKGLHFPRVGMVGVINADTALNLPDFRASEKTFQLLMQVSGRAGRGEERGEVVVQTYAPHHHAIRFAAAHDFIGFYEHEIEAREELVYPPFSRVIRFLLRGEIREEVKEEGLRTRSLLEEELKRPGADWQRHGRSWFRLIGPAEAPLARVRGKYRWHLLIKSGRWEALHDLIRAAARRFREEPGPGKGRVDLVVDVDPVDML
jgi:primosomal protein N' (replication factor Y)